MNSAIDARVLGLAAAIAVSGAPVLARDAPAGVAFESTPAGRTFVTAEGRALYWSRDELAAGAVTCIEECLAERRPLAAETDGSTPPGWSVVVRPDGSRQWVFAGKPLYTFAGDTYPGARLGAGGLWALMFETAELPAGFGVQSTLLGRVLADYKGRTLYIRVSRAPQTDDADWQPLAAPWLAAADGDWSFAPLPDGTRQWVYKGHPLFRYARDRDPQDVRGHGRASGAWTAVVLEPPPALPAWVTVQRVDLGWVFANRDGLTLYAPANFQRIKDAQTCNHACMEQYWRPVLAGPEDTPIGRWTITVNEAGQRQWTFAGRPLFLHTRDTKPGEMTGNSFAVGYAIGDGFRVIPIELNLPPAS